MPHHGLWGKEIGLTPVRIRLDRRVCDGSSSLKRIQPVIHLFKAVGQYANPSSASIEGMKGREPYCLKCNDTRLLTAVFDKGHWFFVPEDEAKNYKHRGRTENCPDCRFAGEPLELPIIMAK